MSITTRHPLQYEGGVAVCLSGLCWHCCWHWHLVRRGQVNISTTSTMPCIFTLTLMNLTSTSIYVFTTPMVRTDSSRTMVEDLPSTLTGISFAMPTGSWHGLETAVVTTTVLKIREETVVGGATPIHAQ